MTSQDYFGLYSWALPTIGSLYLLRGWGCEYTCALNELLYLWFLSALSVGSKGLSLPVGKSGCSWGSTS